MYSSVIFDMDGLLIDSERPTRDASLKAFKEFALPLTDSIYLQTVGTNAYDTEKIFKDHFGEGILYEQIIERREQLLHESLQQDGYHIKPGVIELLELLSAKKIPSAVASSTARPELEQRLTSVNLKHYFREFSGGNEVTRGKPEPDLFLLTSERLGVSPDQCLVFEDSDYGAQAAHAAGMSVIIVPDLKQPNSELRELALAVLSSLIEAPPYLESWILSHSVE